MKNDAAGGLISSCRYYSFRCLYKWCCNLQTALGEAFEPSITIQSYSLDVNLQHWVSYTRWVMTMGIRLAIYPLLCNPVPYQVSIHMICKSHRYFVQGIFFLHSDSAGLVAPTTSDRIVQSLHFACSYRRIGKSSIPCLKPAANGFRIRASKMIAVVTSTFLKIVLVFIGTFGKTSCRRGYCIS